MSDGNELPNPEKIRTLRENENYKVLGILDANTIKLAGKTEKEKKQTRVSQANE